MNIFYERSANRHEMEKCKKIIASNQEVTIVLESNQEVNEGSCASVFFALPSITNITAIFTVLFFCLILMAIRPQNRKLIILMLLCSIFLIWLRWDFFDCAAKLYVVVADVKKQESTWLLSSNHVRLA
jgi:hypothetical protein